MDQTQTITYAEPIEISTKVGADVDSKGNVKPHAEITIKRKLESDCDVFAIISDDVRECVDKVQQTVYEMLAGDGV
ncbi:hypothetical protein RE476_02785 [Methanolobus mangrovi]|uniref:Uncharacterized protein n=1 Tax=Methanolobus mangrovi TaxID=3072977 RepID=A0AA51UGL8_9EURY|nr:hypothetical protein [Methanolobus mangrovi]WMW22765.1 hypothetical protein RE476_02785 [Methanolobus mangrovi]